MMGPALSASHRITWCFDDTYCLKRRLVDLTQSVAVVESRRTVFGEAIQDNGKKLKTGGANAVKKDAKAIIDVGRQFC